MRKIYTSLVCLCMFYHGYGKTTSISVPNLYPYFGNSSTITTPGSGNGYSRIIGAAYATFNGTGWQEIDSTTYSYASGRGGELNEEYADDFVKFEHSYTYVYNAAAGAYVNRLHRWQTYQFGKATSYTCQSWRPSTLAWRDSARFLYTYNNDFSRLESTMFQIWYGSLWADHVYYDNTFDATNRVVEMKSNVYRFSLSYDPSGNVAQRIDQTRTSSTPWENHERFNFTYNASGNITSYMIEIWDGAAWKNSEKYDYTYSGTDITNLKEYRWDSGNWEAYGQSNFVYDGAHNKLNEDWQTWDAATSTYVNATQYSWTYNTYRQPLTYASRTWDPAAGTWTLTTDDFSYHYYYQDYIPTAVKEVLAGDAAIRLYPQPASDKLNIGLKQDNPSSYTLMIYDVQGKLLKQDKLPLGAELYTVQVNELPSGTYFLKVLSADKVYSKQFIVTR